MYIRIPSIIIQSILYVIQMAITIKFFNGTRKIIEVGPLTKRMIPKNDAIRSHGPKPKNISWSNGKFLPISKLNSKAKENNFISIVNTLQPKSQYRQKINPWG